MSVGQFPFILFAEVAPPEMKFVKQSYRTNIFQVWFWVWSSIFWQRYATWTWKNSNYLQFPCSFFTVIFKRILRGINVSQTSLVYENLIDIHIHTSFTTITLWKILESCINLFSLLSSHEIKFWMKFSCILTAMKKTNTKTFPECLL